MQFTLKLGKMPFCGLLETFYLKERHMAEKTVSTDSLAMDSGKKAYKGPKLRVAVIGCGGIAQTHMASFAKMPEVEVVAGVDILPERLKTFEEKWGVTKLYKDWNQMLREVKPDAVDVCTPNGVHAPAVIDSCNAGCHAMTEKPMAMTTDECRKMIEAAKKAKKKLAVGFQYRFHPSTEMLVRAREKGMFGNIMFTRVQALRRRGIPNWGVFGQKHLQGGGPMIDIGVHIIEMSHYTMGSPRPVAATGNIWTYLGNKKSQVVSQWPNWDHKTYTVEDLAIGHIRFENGAIMHIEAMFAGHIEKDVWNFQIMGDKGGATWDPTVIFHDEAGTMFNSSPAFTPRADFTTLFDAKLQNWVDACLKGVELRAPGAAGLDVQKMLNGVYDSAEKGGKEVTID